MTFFIGAGDNQDAQTPRTQDGGAGAPLLPFQGLIQSVALYNTALDPTDLASHFQNGAGTGLARFNCCAQLPHQICPQLLIVPRAGRRLLTRQW